MYFVEMCIYVCIVGHFQNKSQFAVHLVRIVKLVNFVTFNIFNSRPQF